MKQFFLIFAAMIGFAICTDAQTLNNDGKLYVVNDTFYMNGIPVSDGELVMLLGEDLYNEEYLTARKNCFMSLSFSCL